MISSGLLFEPVPVFNRLLSEGAAFVAFQKLPLFERFHMRNDFVAGHALRGVTLFVLGIGLLFLWPSELTLTVP